MTADISVRDLVKHYLVPEREGGLRASIKGIFKRRHRRVRAVDGISFEKAKQSDFWDGFGVRPSGDRVRERRGLRRGLLRHSESDARGVVQGRGEQMENRRHVLVRLGQGLFGREPGRSNRRVRISGLSGAERRRGGAGAEPGLYSLARLERIIDRRQLRPASTPARGPR